MDSNKLYNALLKTQERQKAEQSRRAADTGADAGAEDSDVISRAEAEQRGSPTADRGESASHRLLEQYRRERPYTVRRDELAEPHRPNWTMVDGEEHPPSLYDSSVSLDLINNPAPWSAEQLRERKIIHPSMPNRDILDAFRQVRIKLRNKAGNDNFSVMVSSLGRKDYSALTAFNLAASFALDSHTSALLIDCNPHQSDLQRLVSVPMSHGVTDFVSDKALKVKDILYPSGIDRLSVIPAGTQATSAVELFSAVRMKDLMSELKGRYPDRYIVINAPPMRASSESRILVRYANQVVLSVPFGEVSSEEILNHVETLGSEKFSGLIFQQ